MYPNYRQVHGFFTKYKLCNWFLKTEEGLGFHWVSEQHTLMKVKQQYRELR